MTESGPGPKIGETLRGKWRLDGRLGKGGMATVFEASHRNGMRAAIKVLHAHVASDPTMKRRFLREGYVANRVDHPGAVRVLDDDETEEGYVFLVMELLEGETLKERWVKDGRKMSLDVTLNLGAMILDVLVAAHERNIVHRDIKPDNVFLLKKGGIKILDFGIARLREGTGNTHATQTGASLGTPAFMPPEQALGHPDEVDARSDIYAVGATLWTLLTGKLVHVAATIPELLIATATQQARPISSVMPDLPPPVVEIIDRALRFNRNDRWPTARAMQEALALARSPGKTFANTMKLAANAPVPAPPAKKASTTTQPLPVAEAPLEAETIPDTLELTPESERQDTPTRAMAPPVLSAVSDERPRLDAASTVAPTFSEAPRTGSSKALYWASGAVAATVLLGGLLVVLLMPSGPNGSLGASPSTTPALTAPEPPGKAATTAPNHDGPASGPKHSNQTTPAPAEPSSPAAPAESSAPEEQPSSSASAEAAGPAEPAHSAAPHTTHRRVQRPVRRQGEDPGSVFKTH